MYLGIYDFMNSNTHVHTVSGIKAEEGSCVQRCTLKVQLDLVTQLYWPFVLHLKE